MARCIRTTGLEVHHRSTTGGNGISNAKVLCQPCHEATASYGKPGTSPPAFGEETKDRARRAAGHQCECTSTSGCH